MLNKILISIKLLLKMDSRKFHAVFAITLNSEDAFIGSAAHG